MVHLLYPLSHFNPRARVGRDRSIVSQVARADYFNPRARVGRDYTWVK